MPIFFLGINHKLHPPNSLKHINSQAKSNYVFYCKLSLGFSENPKARQGRVDILLELNSDESDEGIMFLVKLR